MVQRLQHLWSAPSLKSNLGAGRLRDILVLAVVSGALAAAFVGGWVTHRMHDAAKDEKSELHSTEHRFVNPLLECTNAENTIADAPTLVSLRALEEFIDQKTSHGRVSFVALYFRDLNNGPWLGINEDEKFAPASLLKVPLIIAWMKAAEKDPAVMARTLKYTGEKHLSELQAIPDESVLAVGQSYPVEELIRRTLVHSNNDAAALLLDHVDKDVLSSVYANLGLPPAHFLKGENIISVRDYSTFFRVLFNASFLDRQSSESLLMVMAGAQYREGLVAGVPQDVEVSHKFGERAIGEGRIRQLHDCGIVYYPDSPYLLCIMTRGDDFESLSSVISQISAFVYSEVDKSQKKKLQTEKSESP